MPSFNTVRHLRRLNTAANAEATAAATESAPATAIITKSKSPAAITISKAKSKLRSEHDPDRALKIYSSVSNHYSSPVSSRYAQELTIKRLAKARRFDDIESLIESQKTDPKITQEPFLATLIRSYGRAGMFDHALRMFNQMEELGTRRSVLSFNALLNACNQSKLYEKVPQLFDDIPQRYGFFPDKVSYGILVKSYCGLGSPEKALEILKEMDEKKVEITAITFTTILDALYRKGMGNEGDKLWDQMIEKGCFPDAATYNVKLMYEHGGKPETVDNLITEMIRVGLKPDTISYNYFMTCYCKNGMMDEAKKVYEALEGNMCNPNAATFRTLIYYLCRNERFEQGYEVFKESVKVHKIPDFGTLKLLVDGLVKNKKIKDAKGLIRTVKKKFPESFMDAWKKVEVELGLVSAVADSPVVVASGDQ